MASSPSECFTAEVAGLGEIDQVRHQLLELATKDVCDPAPPMIVSKCSAASGTTLSARLGNRHEGGSLHLSRMRPIHPAPRESLRVGATGRTH